MKLQFTDQMKKSQKKYRKAGIEFTINENTKRSEIEI